MGFIMEDKPFYLKGNGKNIIKKKDLETFKLNNPEIKQHLENQVLELRLLNLSTLESLSFWILSQQISGYVAEKLIQRFKDLVGEINPKNILDISDQEFRNIGLSGSKIEYIRNVALFVADGNDIENVKNYSSTEIKSYYQQIKGIGSWTCNMHLIFVLGRKDILASKDLVVRKGVKQLYDLDEIPSPKEVGKICENWGELATIGTILSWAVMGE